MGPDRSSRRIVALRFSILAAIGVALGCEGSTPSDLPRCTSPTTDPVTGLVSCREGYDHRPRATRCAVDAASAGAGGASSDLPRAPAWPDAVRCGEDPTSCDAFELGYCEARGGGAAPSTCYSGCKTDEDCGEGHICICEDASPTGGKCRPSDCSTNDDCEPGYRCASYDVPCDLEGFTCQRADDACTGLADCEDSTCNRFGSETRECSAVACGRPFLIEQLARVAPAVVNGDWRDTHRSSPELSHLSALEREQLAEHWTRLGQLEHASIAAFARFNLQLLALGAPPELIQACTQALADETAHTRLCFELASTYAGHDVGPSRLDLAGSLVEASLSEIVDLVIAEGCFGETGAALDALDAAARASDPVVRDVYAQIAADEQRHAELAFRFVRWALAQDPTRVSQRLRAALRYPPMTHRAAAQVALPCFEALLQAVPVTPAQELVT